MVGFASFIIFNIIIIAKVAVSGVKVAIHSSPNYVRFHVGEMLQFITNLLHDSTFRDSFDPGLCMACLVRMLDDVLLLHNWDNNYLFCSPAQL